MTNAFNPAVGEDNWQIRKTWLQTIRQSFIIFAPRVICVIFYSDKHPKSAQCESDLSTDLAEKYSSVPVLLTTVHRRGASLPAEQWPYLLSVMAALRNLSHKSSATLKLGYPKRLEYPSL